ncbi:site-specific DNA-methyltransferase [Vibrio cyclitrophicus]|uniref:site-specific DNA-methyltransferase n=1 Tax=Vibrio cyclitrophicus TaxID=47951 RepID=UPI00399A4EB4
MSDIEKITGNSPEAKSLDITQQNIEQLKQLFPDVFSENKVDFEALKAVLGEAIDDSEERYNFSWNGKAKARQIAQTPSTGTLRPCKEESVNWDTTENLFIEGDNLEVLKLLQKSYHKKVKMIYINPPYNTGKDFVYKDNFHDNLKNYLEISGQLDFDGNKISTNSDSSGRYHSSWLNMIYPRLKLARNLLRDDGVIFISIDDNELANLLEVCDEIFGSDNRRGIVSRPTGTPSGQGYDILVNEIDYVLVYSKTSSAALKGLPFSAEDEKIYDQEDEYGKFLTRTLRKTGGEDRREDRPTMHFGIQDPDGNTVYPVGPTGYESRWRCGEDSYFQLITENRIQWKKSNTGEWKPYQKFYLEGRLKQASNLWQGIEGNKKASLTIKELFDGKAFDTPKPVGLISRCIQIATSPQDIVLDFFAGSATTAHAIMASNINDGGKRKFIMVQLPEPCTDKSEAFRAGYRTISEVSIARIKKAAAKLTRDYPDNDVDLGVKIMTLDTTNIRPWDADFDNLEQVLQQATESIKADRSSEDVLYEIFLKYGYDLTTPVETEVVNGKTVFVVGAGALIVCLDDEITGETVEGIAKLKEELDPETTQVVFKDAGFADSNVKTNAIQILKQAGIDDVKSI